MLRYFVWILLTVMMSGSALAAPSLFKIYLDADRTGHLESALSIEQGVKVAFAEVDNQINGVPVEFVVTDHRGNAKRSKKNMDRFLSDPDALVFIAGMHSPPLIKYRDFINQSGLLTLVPWAAGTPITRYPDSSNNYVFRLSVDDSKVGKILVDHAAAQQCQQPHLVLENTGWGKSNFKAMMKALPDDSSDQVQTAWFDWGIRASDARIIVREAQQQGADCLLMVSNAREGKIIIEAVSEVGETMPVYSHWGITGGQFADSVPYQVREKASLRFVQSCFNFYSSEMNEFRQQVFSNARKLFPDTFSQPNIDAPAGFVHGYDLSKVFIQAASSVELGSDMGLNRKMLKQALETLQQPVQGLVKEYRRPFSAYSQDNVDAHEALGSQDYCMAYYDDKNAVKLLSHTTAGAN
ncbi:MAG: ABC transporter substrate-binding protein [Pseudomonadota bacterium]